jgi:hypothetical protein
MGQLDQFAKRTFADETEPVTGGGVTWQIPPEIGFSHIQGDGVLVVRRRDTLAGLPAPWSEAAAQDEVLLESKMGGDHLDEIAFERAALRRQARQVQRAEVAREARLPAPDQQGVWRVAPRVPQWLRRERKVEEIGPGCHRVGPAWYQFLWVAANELPLRDELVPFLVARSGRRLDEFAEWVAPRRPLEWVMDMLQSLNMSEDVREDLKRRFGPTDDPVVKARRQDILRWLLAETPEVQQELIEKGNVAEARRLLTSVLAWRGLMVSPAQELQIAACEDLALLERWHKQAVTAESADEALS